MYQLPMINCYSQCMRKLMSERNVGISIRDMWQHTNMYVLVCLHDFFILINLVRIVEWVVVESGVCWR